MADEEKKVTAGEKKSEKSATVATVKVEFPKEYTGFSHGTREYSIKDGVCEIPETEVEVIAAAKAQAQSHADLTNNLAAIEARARMNSPAGQGQEFARALLRELLGAQMPQLVQSPAKK